jgi:mono/diheme cytochrome c family protein
MGRARKILTLEGQAVNRFVKPWGIAVLLGATVGVLLLAPKNLSSSVLAAPASAQDVYLDKCSVCHAQDGSGNTAKGRKLKVKNVRSAEVQKLTTAEMIDNVAKGKGKDMDGFEKELGPELVKQLVTYYRSLAKP